MQEVIPSFYGLRQMVPQSLGARRFWGIYSGEVLAVVYPEDPNSVTKKFVEYSVAVQAYDNGTLALLNFPHCLLSNPLAGLADQASWTLRPDPKSGQKGAPGLGSKVIVACVNGDLDSAVILGGWRDDADPGDAKADGHHLDLVFNGVRVNVDLDGALTVTREGVTRIDGTLDEDASPKDQVGAFVTLDAKGGFKVATVRADDKGNPVEEQSVTLDHETSTMTVTTAKGLVVEVTDGPATLRTKKGIEVTADGEDVKVTAAEGDVTMAAPKGHVRAGASADQPMVLGDDLVSWLQDLLKAVQQLTVGTGVGPSSPPINAAAFAQLGQRASAFLSKAAQVAKSP